MTDYAAHVMPGDLVFLNHWRLGLMPARYVALSGDYYGDRAGITVQLTADRPGYRRGETLGVRPDDVWPRGQVRKSRRYPGCHYVIGGLAGWAFYVSTPEGPQVGTTST